MADGRVEYEVRADTSKLDSDLSQAQAKVVKSSQETADKQEKAAKEVVKTTEKCEKEKVAVSEKSQKSITKTAKTEGDKVVKEHKQDTEKIVKQSKQGGAEIEQSVEKVSSSVVGSIGKAVAAIGGITAAVSGVKAIVSSVVGLDKGGNQIAAALGLSAEEAKKYKDIIKDVYADNFGESFEDISNTIALIKQQMKDIGDDELKGATEAAYMLADVYDIDIAEGIRGANSLVKQFGISAEQAYNLMSQGAEKGLNQNGDLADQIAEYATYYSQLGFSAQDAFNMMSTAAESGVYQIDKINDAVKEFGIRSIDGSQTTADGFHALGLDAEKLGKAFSDGGETAKEAFNIVINALADMDDSVAQDAAGVALFGTQWEDLGADAVLSLKSVNGEIDITRNKLNEIKEIKYDDLGSMLTTLKRKFELMLQPLGEQLIPIIIEVVEELTPIVESIIPSLIDFIPVVADVIKTLLPIVSDILKFIVQFKDVLGPLAIGLGAAKVAMTLFTKACNINPITLAIGAIATLAIGIGKIAKQATSCSDEVQALVNSIDNMRSRCDDTIAQGEAECQILRDKAARYEELRGNIERTADEEAELKGLALDLQSTLGDNCTLINGLTNEYYSAADAVDVFCQKKMNEIKLTASKEMATEAYKQIAEIDKQIKKVEEAHQEDTSFWGIVKNVASNVLNKTTYGWLGEDISAHYMQQNNDYQALITKKSELQSNIDEWFSLEKENYKTSGANENKSVLTPDLVYMSDEEQAAFYGKNLNQIIADRNSRKPSYSYTPPPTTEKSSSGSSSSSASSASTASSVSAAKPSGNTINIASFIPTVWDDATTANAKLAAGGIASNLIGNSKSGKLIDGLSSTASATISTAEEVKDATLNDVVKAINSLKTEQEKMQYTLDVTLKTDNYTLAKATVKGINAITKSTGKSPLT